MRRPGLRSLVAGATGVSALLTLGVSLSVAAEQTAVETDRIFMQALARSEKAVAGPLLDPELLWTDWEGKSQGRSQVIEHFPTATIGDSESQSYSYDQVVTVRSDSGKLHVLRIWVKRPAGWRLLVYHEVKQAEKAGSPAPPIKECVNPCQVVPYRPKNDAEAGVFKSWQALETAVTAGDSRAWATHFADEFMVIGSGATAPVTKAGRMAALDAQKQAGTNGAPAGLAPDHTRMFTFGNTVVMTCQTLPHRGRPAHVTRVWINRGGAWLMTVSFQTMIQAAPSVTND